MANHELIIICKGCGNRFDARIHGLTCPDCELVHVFAAPVPTPRPINHRRLPSMGFKEHSIDVDGHELPYYTKEFAPLGEIEVTPIFNPDGELMRQTGIQAEVTINGESTVVPIYLESDLRELYRLLAGEVLP